MNAWDFDGRRGQNYRWAALEIAMSPTDVDSAKLARGRELHRATLAYKLDHAEPGDIITLPVATWPPGCPYPLFEP